MTQNIPISLISRCYGKEFGARPSPTFDSFMVRTSRRGITAALGYRPASQGRLFLENYIDEPIEAAVSRAWGRQVVREHIVELGNFAASNAMAMIELWGTAANDLGSASQIAVATLTAPLRTMFARIGLPVVELASAHPDSIEDARARWGTYYDMDPCICAGNIMEGQQALARYLAQRGARTAA